MCIIYVCVFWSPLAIVLLITLFIPSTSSSGKPRNHWSQLGLVLPILLDTESIHRFLMITGMNTVIKVARSLLAQRLNGIWHIFKEGRLAASNFSTRPPCKKGDSSEYCGEYGVKGVKSVVWKMNHISFVLWLEKVPRALVDGSTGGDSLFEIKCSCSLLNDSVIVELKLKELRTAG